MTRNPLLNWRNMEVKTLRFQTSVKKHYNGWLVRYHADLRDYKANDLRERFFQGVNAYNEARSFRTAIINKIADDSTQEFKEVA